MIAPVWSQVVCAVYETVGVWSVVCWPFRVCACVLTASVRRGRVCKAVRQNQDKRKVKDKAEGIRSMIQRYTLEYIPKR